MTQIVIRNIILPFTADQSQVIAEAKKRLRPFLRQSDIESVSVYKRSLDARKRDNICYVYTALAECRSAPDEQKLKKASCDLLCSGDLTVEFGNEEMNGRPVVIGFGPAGIFAAMLLAEYGYRPLVIERGGNIASRSESVARFYRDRILDGESNIQFGAGGAGAFSDGKLVTRINDPKCRYVLERFFSLGADRSILTESKPHVGTDILKKVVANADEYIKKLGGDVLYDTAVTDFVIRNGKVTALKTKNGDIACSAVIVATGHSSRDTYKKLFERNFGIINKPFSVGVRIEHLQSEVDKSLYGDRAGHPLLPKGEYALSKIVDGRGVYTFCMCPGGEVVAAASEEGGVVTNGMSSFARSGKNANAAIAVNVSPDDPMSFQRKLERAAFVAGGKNYNAPMQTVGDFLNGTRGSEPSRVEPTYMGGNRCTLCDLDDILPEDISKMLKTGITDFSRKMSCFASGDAILTGLETRTSAPYRIIRNETLTSPDADNFYPCGEGAGYAGGITSAAVDGLACALALMKRYKIPKD